jgi:hypothetical protein
VKTHKSITTVSHPEGSTSASPEFSPAVVVMAVDKLVLELTDGHDGLEVWLRHQGGMIPVKAFSAATTGPLGNVYSLSIANATCCVEAVFAQDSVKLEKLGRFRISLYKT